jgi:thiamine biosynthesis protein ThiS
MTIFLNGATVECNEGLTIEGLLKTYHLSLEATLVEQNGIALHRHEWVKRKVQENDRFEILSVAAGG